MNNEDKPNGSNEATEQTEKIKTPLERIASIRRMLEEGRKLGFNDELIQNLNDQLYSEVLNTIKPNCESHKETTQSGIKGTRINLTLPEIGESFKKFEFSSLITGESIEFNEFDNNPELEKKSISINELIELINQVDKYINCCGLETDGKAEYDETTNTIKGGEYARDVLNGIMCFPGIVLLKNKNIGGKISERACYIFGKKIDYLGSGLYGHLRLK